MDLPGMLTAPLPAHCGFANGRLLCFAEIPMATGAIPQKFDTSMTATVRAGNRE
jgi:hypothetical protein